MSETNKQKILIGTEFELTKQELEFFSTQFEVETVLFEQLLKKKPANRLSFLYFSGGSDVSPDIYGENIGKFTSVDRRRDELCRLVNDTYITTPKLGICRGAQFLTVMAGGKLIQHVTGHTDDHSISILLHPKIHPTTFQITSTHHQMMYPFNLDSYRYELLAWSTKYRSTTYLDGSNIEISLPDKFVEPEIVFYNRQRSLAIQGHPEFTNCPSGTKELCLKLISSYLL